MANRDQEQHGADNGPAKEGQAHEPKGDLLAKEDAANEQFNQQVERTLIQTEADVLELPAHKGRSDFTESWQRARLIVTAFRPVPSFIWRITNHVLNKPGTSKKLSEGFVYGMRRLLFAASSDKVLGAGEKINNVHRALEILKPDVIAAISVIHAVARRLQSKNREHERIWRPMLDDAIVRSHIGFFVGNLRPDFGPGRGMLAGFAGRCGLVILIAQGTADQARQALETLATGSDLRAVGMKVYNCDPLQISAMTLSASGCGRDAAFGTVSYASTDPQAVVGNDEQLCWLSAFTITDLVRTNRIDEVNARYWKTLNFAHEGDKSDLQQMAKALVRKGHSWGWLG